MINIQDVSNYMDKIAPTRLAEDWDNVGLLVGDPETEVQKIMTCLTITPASAQEAIASGAQLIVTHHPLPFRPLKKITTQKTPTRLLWQLINNGIAIYSPHTGFDSASGGINQRVCEKVGLTNITPLKPFENDSDGLGAGRFGDIQTTTCSQFANQLKDIFGLQNIRYVGKESQNVQRIASACGSGGSFLQAAVKSECNAMITGEADFHTCLEAQAQGLCLFLLGHYASERFAVEMLANELNQQFPDLEIWSSEKESDPIAWS